MTIKEEQKDERVKKRINNGLDEPYPWGCFRQTVISLSNQSLALNPTFKIRTAWTDKAA